MSNHYLSTTGTPTPGPWKSLKEDDLGFQVDVVADVVVGANVHKHIAACPFDGRFMKDGESVANARLVAAAPDLLASCNELREALAGAMRVIHAHDNGWRGATSLGLTSLTDIFVEEMARIGIANGVGVRADAAIAKTKASQEPVKRASVRSDVSLFDADFAVDPHVEVPGTRSTRDKKDSQS